MLKYESDGFLIYDITTDKDVCICSSYEMRDKLLNLLNMTTSKERITVILEMLKKDWGDEKLEAIQKKLSDEEFIILATTIDGCVLDELEQKDIITIN